MTIIKRLLPLCLLFPLTAVAQDATVHEYKLDNGLKLIVKEDHRSPVVVSQVWYKVGSSYEHDGITGLSHALEHMMFKGTSKHGPNEFSRIIADNGGQENAFTSRDYTAYFQEMEKDRLKVSFDLESDRMRHLTLSPNEFKKEIQVVMEERRMRTDDDPESLTGEQFEAVAFLNSAYRIPVIGWMDDLKHMQVEDLRKWYETWYAPNNAIVVVVGDVDPQQVYAMAKQYFGPLKRSPVPEVKPRNEIHQTGIRRIVVKAPAELPYVIMGYKVPVLKTATQAWEPYALDVLAGILDGGGSARLATHLIRGTQVAAQADADYSMTPRSENLFSLDGTPAQGHTAAELEKALLEQVHKLRDAPVSDEELKRVKAQVVADDVYQRDSVFYQAMRIGSLEAVGLSWRLEDQYVDKIKAVTAQQVQEVARRYLGDDQLTVATLEPLPISDEERMRRSQHSGGDNVR